MVRSGPGFDPSRSLRIAPLDPRPLSDVQIVVKACRAPIVANSTVRIPIPPVVIAPASVRRTKPARWPREFAQPLPLTVELFPSGTDQRKGRTDWLIDAQKETEGIEPTQDEQPRVAELEAANRDTSESPAVPEHTVDEIAADQRITAPQPLDQMIGTAAEL